MFAARAQASLAIGPAQVIRQGLGLVDRRLACTQGKVIFWPCLGTQASLSGVCSSLPSIGRADTVNQSISVRFASVKAGAVLPNTPVREHALPTNLFDRHGATLLNQRTLTGRILRRALHTPSAFVTSLRSHVLSGHTAPFREFHSTALAGQDFRRPGIRGWSSVPGFSGWPGGGGGRRRILPRGTKALVIVGGMLLLVIGLKGVFMFLALTMFPLLVIIGLPLVVMRWYGPGRVLRWLAQSTNPGGLVHGWMTGIARHAQVYAVRDARGQRLFIPVLQRAAKNSSTMLNFCGREARVRGQPLNITTSHFSVGGSVNFVPLPGSGSTTTISIMLPIEERGVQKGVLQVSARVDPIVKRGVDGSSGGTASPLSDGSSGGFASAIASAWQNVKFYASDQAQHEQQKNFNAGNRINADYDAWAQHSSAAGSATADDQQRGGNPRARDRWRRRPYTPRGGAAAGSSTGGQSSDAYGTNGTDTAGGGLNMFDDFEGRVQDMLAADEEGKGPLSGEEYQYTILSAVLVLPCGQCIDVLPEMGGLLRSDDVARGSSSSYAWPPSRRAAEGEHDDSDTADVVGGSRQGRTIDAEWKEKRQP